MSTDGQQDIYTNGVTEMSTNTDIKIFMATNSDGPINMSLNVYIDRQQDGLIEPNMYGNKDGHIKM